MKLMFDELAERFVASEPIEAEIVQVPEVTKATSPDELTVQTEEVELV